MSDKQIFYLIDVMRRRNCIQAINDAPVGYRVEIFPQKRTLDQNALLWPYLTGLHEQKQWPVNGVMVNLTKVAWKTLLTAAFRQDLMQMAPGINGGIVMLGEGTSRMNKKEFSEFMQFVIATCVDWEVKPVFKKPDRRYENDERSY